MEYDAAGRMVRVRTDALVLIASYTYGDSNQRLMSDEGGVRTYFVGDGGSVLSEYVESGTSTSPQWAKAYVYFGGRMLAAVQSTGGSAESVSFHHPDRLGTRLVTSPHDGSYSEQEGLPYGTVLDAVAATSRRFTSYERSGATGLDYAVNRQYDPLQGRFTQVDPIEMGAADLSSPQTLNLYAYCSNDPVNNTDPDGLFSLGGLFRAIGRAFKTILKWAVVAVVITVAVTLTVAALSPVGSPGLAFASWMWNTVLPPLISGLGTLTGVSAGGALAGTGVFNPGAGSGVGTSSWRRYAANLQQDEDLTKLPADWFEDIGTVTAKAYSRWDRIKSGAGRAAAWTLSAITRYQQYLESTRLRGRAIGEWIERRLEEGSPKVQIGTYPNGNPIYMGFGVSGTTRSITRGLGNIGGGAANASRALSNAERWLGPGYREIAPGVFRSRDGLRQFRMRTSDLLDPAQGPHVHFEAIGPNGRTIIENSHVRIKP